MADEQRRNAERVKLKEPIAATIGDVAVQIVEISLIGGRIEHIPKLAMNSNVTLQLHWTGETIRLKAKIARTEMRSIGGKLGYSSGIDFAKTPAEAPAPLQRIIASYLQEAETPVPIPVPVPVAVPEPPRVQPKPPPPPPPPSPVSDQPAPFMAEDDDVEEIAAEAEVAPYVQCVWGEEQWLTKRTNDPKQPLQGFTMIAPETDQEVDDFCRTYEMADPETQRMIRLSFELAIAQQRRG